MAHPDAVASPQNYDYATPPSTKLAPAGATQSSSQQQQQQQSHQRTYQACIPCRRRKVRCDLGSVDNPHDPPCKRCSRESKECFFSATRRKKKNANGTDVDSDGAEDDVYEIKNGRKRLRTSAPQEESESPQIYEERPRTPGGSRGRPVPLRRPTGSRSHPYGEEDEKASEQTAAILQAAEVHGGHDALKVLYQAALRGRTNSGTSMGRPVSMAGISPRSLPPATSPIVDKTGATSYTTGPMAMYQGDNMWEQQIDPAITKPTESTTTARPNPSGYAAALNAWSRFRFVRAGWLTAKEAIDYVDYFYKYLLPLTPVDLPTFRSYENHEKLLRQEPMLTITILLISSRHMKLEGPGSLSRPYSIHQKLWTYLSGMIDRVVWGQEQFGGGFCGAGSEPGSDVNPLTRKGLRTLGTVESLVLLTEWHPRAMHFPPDDDDSDLMMDDYSFTPDLSGNTDNPKLIGGQRMDAWLEPCWRSDRMCWMLLGMAMSLSFEIGVFDSTDWQRHAKSTSTVPLSAEDLQAYDRRRGTVRELMLIYVTQTSGRLGLTSMLPATYTKPEDSSLYKRQPGQHESMQETILHFWLRMAAILREGNQKIFANKFFTRDLIRNGDYKAALDGFDAPLNQWRADFDRCSSIPKYMRCILLIEFEYCRVYINALALQAVAERCANEQPIPILDPPLDMARSAISTNGIRSDVAIDANTLSKWLGGDRKYMVTVGEAARNLLKVVVDELFPGEYLKHAPVRTYFRIISVAIMLLKSFSLGATESDVAESLLLMERTVDALRTCIVDDVHVASRFADLLDTLTTNLKPRLVRIAPDGQHGRSRRVSHYNIAEAGPAEINSATQKLHAHAQQQTTHNGVPNPPQWSYQTQMPSGTMSVASSNAQANPLFGISNDTYDLFNGDNTYSIMPPPSFGLHSPNATRSNPGLTPGGNSTYDAYSNFAGTDDWLALPLDPLLNISGADVDQTMYGPQLGGQDMLELLLGSSNAQPTNGTGFN